MEPEIALLNRLAKLEKSAAKQQNNTLRIIDEAMIQRIKAQLEEFAV
jgi:hypothetical protein